MVPPHVGHWLTSMADAGEQDGPGESMSALLWCEWDLLAGWLSGWRRVGRNDLATVSGTGGEYTVVSQVVHPEGFEPPTS